MVTTSQFVERAKARHGDRFDYSPSRYAGFQQAVQIECREHGRYETTPKRHLATKSGGCPKCRIRLLGARLRCTQQDFIARARQVHGSHYDYSLVDYRGHACKVTIVCPRHGPFRMSPDRHLAGRGCRRCAFERIGRERRMTFWEFVDRVARVHGRHQYEYELQDFVNLHSKIPIRCPEHGLFRQTVAAHLRGHGCPACIESAGERRIRDALRALDVAFDEQVRFTECRNDRPLPFDFFVPGHRLLIEFDGRQHYDNSEHWGGREKLAETQRHDRIKDRFAAENGYRLLRIPYWDLDRVEDIVLEALASSACTEGIV